MHWFATIFLIFFLLLKIPTVAKATPTYESPCLKKLNDILPTSCRQNVMEDFTENEDTGDPLFEETCESFVVAVKIIREKFPNSSCKHLSLLASIINRLTQGPDPYKTFYVNSLMHIVRLFMQFEPSQLEDFLEIINFRPQLFKHYFLDFYGIWKLQLINESVDQYVPFIFNIAKFIKLLEEKGAKDCRYFILSIIRLGINFVTIMRTVVLYFVNISIVFEGSGDELKAVVEAIMRFIERFVKTKSDYLEIVLEEILGALLDLISCFYYTSCTGDIVTKVTAFLKYVSNLLQFDFTDMLLDFLKLANKFCCQSRDSDESYL